MSTDERKVDIKAKTDGKGQRTNPGVSLTNKEKQFLNSLKPRWGFQPIDDRWQKQALDVAGKGYVEYDSSQAYRPGGRIKVRLLKPGMDFIRRNSNLVLRTETRDAERLVSNPEPRIRKLKSKLLR